MNLRSFIYLLLVVAVGGGVWYSTKDAKTNATGANKSSESDPDVNTQAKSGGDPTGLAFDGLDEDRQKFIWDAEHFTFEIETYVGKPLSKVLVDGDVSQLDSFLADGFEASLLNQNEFKTYSRSVAVEKTFESRQTETADSTAFKNYIAARIDQISDVKKAKLRVLKITQPDPADAKLWRLKTLLTVSGKTSDGKQAFFDQHATVLCRFETDKDIRAKNILTNWAIDSESFRTSQSLFTEFTDTSGLAELPIHDNWKTPDKPRQYTSQLASADFDLDGYTDLAIATADGQLFVMKSEKGQRFTNVTASLGLPEEDRNQYGSFLATWFDFNNDGYPDLLLGSRLYESEGGKKFHPVNSGIRLGMSPMGTAVADYDCDGLLDLYLLYQHQKPTGGKTSKKKTGWVSDDDTGAQNELWQNKGNGRFTLVTSKAGVSGGRRHSFAAAWLHANEDHYPDLYVANDFAQNSFFINNGDGTFTDASESSGTADFATSMGVTAGDLTGDGKSEIYVANMYSKMGRRIIAQVDESDYPDGVYEQLKGACAGNRLYRPGEGDKWNEASEPAGINAVGWAYAPAFSDFDGDGRLDIYAAAGFMSFRRDKPDG